ncbi:hypothetical protein PMO01_01625 [Pseudomonas moraviensis R28-S]|uniref:Uncharacterized protein n=1 Tax=Pseudomonas moraviensis R28-S TaxID=1395516 RepID=V8RFS0_9PSED|nr:hypothetical protein PMO01_01625 [Pseudomonas moraviensis R28-S]
MKHQKIAAFGSSYMATWRLQELFKAAIFCSFQLCTGEMFTAADIFL